MKKILIAVFVAFVFIEGAFVLAVYQPQNLGWVNLSIATSTVNQINASTAPTIGYPYFCTDCTAAGGKGTICISTSTAAPGGGSDFVLSTGTICK